MSASDFEDFAKENNVPDSCIDLCHRAYIRGKQQETSTQLAIANNRIATLKAQLERPMNADLYFLLEEIARPGPYFTGVPAEAMRRYQAIARAALESQSERPSDEQIAINRMEQVADQLRELANVLDLDLAEGYPLAGAETQL